MPLIRMSGGSVKRKTELVFDKGIEYMPFVVSSDNSQATYSKSDNKLIMQANTGFTTTYVNASWVTSGTVDISQYSQLVIEGSFEPNTFVEIGISAQTGTWNSQGVQASGVTHATQLQGTIQSDKMTLDLTPYSGQWHIYASARNYLSKVTIEKCYLVKR